MKTAAKSTAAKQVTVTVIVEGGVVSEIQFSPRKSAKQVRVVVRDYDVTEDNELKKDFNGDLYSESVWSE